MGTGFGRRNPQEDNWDGNRGNDGQESHNGEQEVSQRGDLEQGFDRWSNSSERGSGTWIWNVDLGVDFDRWHNGSE